MAAECLLSTHCGHYQPWQKEPMGIVSPASAVIAALRSILPMSQCFELAAQKRVADALNLVAKTREATRNNRFADWDIELQLLEAYLLLEQESFLPAQMALSGAFTRIRRSSKYNSHEQAVLIRYGISVLWFARGRPEPSCLLVIRQRLTFDGAKVRGSIMSHFPNPDETVES